MPAREGRMAACNPLFWRKIFLECRIRKVDLSYCAGPCSVGWRRTMRRWVRWRGGEVDIVALGRRQSPDRCVEVERSDRHFRNPGLLKGLREVAKRHPRAFLLATTRTDTRNAEPWGDGSHVSFTPTGLCCYPVGEAAIRDPSATGFRAVGVAMTLA